MAIPINKERQIYMLPYDNFIRNPEIREVKYRYIKLTQLIFSVINLVLLGCSLNETEMVEKNSFILIIIYSGTIFYPILFLIFHVKIRKCFFEVIMMNCMVFIFLLISATLKYNQWWKLAANHDDDHVFQTKQVITNTVFMSYFVSIINGLLYVSEIIILIPESKNL